MASTMKSRSSPLDFIRPYIDSGFDVIIWKNPGTQENDLLTDFVSRLEQKGFKSQIVVMPEPPPGYPAPPFYPELTLTILKESVTDDLLNMSSEFLKQVYQTQQKITVKVDIVLDQRILSVESNGNSSEVGGTLKNILKIAKLTSSNLVFVAANQEQIKPVKAHFCSKCGASLPIHSDFCPNCGEKQ
jgi:hypothetical protein